MAQEIGVVLTVKGAQSFITSLLKAQGQLTGLAGKLIDAADTIQQFEAELRKQGGGGAELFDKFKIGNVVGQLSFARSELDELGKSFHQLATDLSSEIKPKSFDELVKSLNLTKEEAREFISQFAQFDEETKQAAQGLNEAAASARNTGEAFKTIDLQELATINFQNLITNMEGLANALAKLGVVSREYKDDLTSPIFNLVNQFNQLNPSKLASIQTEVNTLVTTFEKDVSDSAQKVDVTGLKDIVDAVRGFSGVSVANIKKIIELGPKFGEFFTSLAGLKPATTTRIDLLVTTFERFEKLNIPPDVATTLKGLTDALSGFVKRISGKFVEANITTSLEAFKQFIAVVEGIGGSGATQQGLADIAAKFNLVGTAITPLTQLIQSFSVSFEPLVVRISDLSHALEKIAKVSSGDLNAALQTSVTALIDFADKFNNGIGDANKFSTDLIAATNGLKTFADAITSVAGRDTIPKFAGNVDQLITSINKLAAELDVADFVSTIAPFAKELQNLADIITGLNSVVGKGTLANIVNVNLTEEQQKLQALKNEGKALTEANKLARARERALDKQAKQAAKAAEEQRKLNATYAFTNLKKSSNYIDQFIGKLIEMRYEFKKTRAEMIKEFGKVIRTSIIVKIEVLGLKIFTRLISLLTLGPVKIVIALGKAFLRLGQIIGSLGITTTIAAIIRMKDAVVNLITSVVKLAAAFGKLVFNKIAQQVQLLFSIVKTLLLPIRILANIFLSIARGAITLTKNLFGLVSVFKILLAPINALINLMTKLNSLFAGGKKTTSPSIDTGSSVESFKQLDKAATDAYTSIDNESQKVTDSQNEIQAEFKETANASKQVDTVKQSLTGLQKVADTINISKTFVFGSNINKLLIGIAALTVSFKALQKVGQLLTQTFQRFSYAIRGIIKDAFDAASTYERLQLTLESLQKRELTNTGEISPFNPDNITQQLDTLKNAFGGANFGDAIKQQSKDSAEGMELVRTRAEELLQWMRALAIQSPFNLEDIANTVKLGQTYGFTTDEAKVLTQAVTDLAAATGQTGEVGEGIIRALGQIRANSRLAKEELNQLAERGVPAIQYLADALTEGDTAALLEAVTDGAVSADVAIKVLSDSIQRDFGGAAALQTQTLSGLLATIQDLRENILRELATPIFDIFKPLVAQFTSLDSINDLLDTAAKYGQILADKVAIGVTYVVQALATMKVYFEAIPQSMKDNIKQFIKFVAVTSAVSVALFGLITVLTKGSLIFFALVNPISALIVVLFKFRTSVFNVFKAVSGYLDILVKAVNDMYNAIKPGLDKVYTAFNTLINNISTLLTSFVNTIFTYGENIGISFANGIANSYNYVLKQLYALADLISYWLSPGSPPKILPDIDEWGTAAANEFLGGFKEADFSSIEDFGSTIEDLVKALELPEGTVDINDIQKDYAELLDTFNSGEITNDAIQNFFSEITKETGALSGDFLNVAEEYVKLAAEQAKLNAATAEYNRQLDETNSQLDTLNQQNEILDQKSQLEEITRILNNRYTTTEQKERAELQRKKILAEQAKAEIEAQQRNVDAQKENIDLLKQRIALDADQSETNKTTGGGSDALGKDAKEKVEKVKEEVAALGEGLETAITPLTNIRDVLQEIKPPKLDFAAIFEKATEDAKAKIDDLKKKFEELGIALGIVKRVAAAVVIALFAPTVVRNAAALAVSVGNLSKALAPIVAIGLGGAAVVTAIAGGLLLLSTVDPQILSDLGNKFFNFGLGVWGGLQLIGTDVQQKIQDNILTPFKNAFEIGDPMFDQRTFAQRIIDGVVAALTTAGTAITTSISTFIQDNITIPFTSGFESADGIQNSILTGLRNVFSPLQTSIEAMIATYIDVELLRSKWEEKISQPFTSAYEGVKNKITGSNLKEQIESGIKAVLDVIKIEISISDLISFTGINPTIFTEIKADIDASFEQLTSNLPTGIVNSFLIVFDSLVNNIRNSGLAQDLISLASAAGELARTLLAIIGAVVGVIGIVFGSIFAEIPTIFQGVINIVTGLIEILNSLVEFFVNVFSGQPVSESIFRLGNAFEEVILGIENIIEGFLNALLNLGIIIAGVFGFEVSPVMVDTIRDNIDRAAHLITDGIEKVKGYAEQWGISVPNITAKLGELDARIEESRQKNRERLDAFIQFLNDTSAAIQNTMANFGLAIWGFVLGIQTNFENAWTNTESFRNKFSEAFNVLSGIITDVVTAITNLKNVFVPLSGEDLYSINLQPLQDLYTILQTSIPTAITELIEVFTGIDITDPFSIATTGAELLADAINILIGLPESIFDAFNSIYSYFTGYTIPNPFTELKTFIDQLPAGVQGLIDKFTVFKDFLSSLELPNPFEALSNAGSRVAGLLGFDQAEEDAKQAGENLATNVKDGVQSGLDTAEVTINTNVVRGDVEEFKTLGESYGKPITEGITKGVEDQANSAETTNAWQRARTGMQNAWNNVWSIRSPSVVANEEMGMPIAEGIIEGIETGVSNENFQPVKDSITANFTDYSDEQGPELGKSFAAKIIDGIRAAFGELDLNSAITSGTEGETASPLASILTFDQEAIDALKTTFTDLFNTIMELLETFIEDYTDTFTTFTEDMQELLEEYIDTILEIVEDTFAQIIEMLVAFAINVLNILNKLMKDIENVMKQFATIMKDAARAGVNAFVEELKDIGEKTKTAITNSFTEAKLGEYATEEGKKLGKAFADGMEAAILAGIPNVVTAVEKFLQAALAALQKGLDTGSPSKVVYNDYGVPFADGLITGILDGIPRVRDAAKGLVDNAKEALGDISDSLGITVPVYTEYVGLKENLPDLSQNIRTNRLGNVYDAGIANMQHASGATIVNNNQNYIMNITVKDTQVADVKRNFAKMQHLRI